MGSGIGLRPVAGDVGGADGGRPANTQSGDARLRSSPKTALPLIRSVLLVPPLLGRTWCIVCTGENRIRFQADVVAVRLAYRWCRVTGITSDNHVTLANSQSVVRLLTVALKTALPITVKLLAFPPLTCALGSDHRAAEYRVVAEGDGHSPYILCPGLVVTVLPMILVVPLMFKVVSPVTAASKAALPAIVNRLTLPPLTVDCVVIVEPVSVVLLPSVTGSRHSSACCLSSLLPPLRSMMMPHPLTPQRDSPRLGQHRCRRLR